MAVIKVSHFPDLPDTLGSLILNYVTSPIQKLYDVFGMSSRENDILKQRLANFFGKGPDHKYFRLFRPYGFCHTHSALLL